MSPIHDPTSLSMPSLKDRDFNRIKNFLFDETGIHLSDLKKSLVASRLLGRLKSTGFLDYGSYYNYVRSRSSGEITFFIDCLTTNETYFFREPAHFEFLAAVVKQGGANRPWQLWSAACSSGEEVYSLAMLMSDLLGKKTSWQITGSDLSSRVIQKARQGHYPMERNEGISPERLRKYCLRGVGKQTGTFLLDKSIGDQVSFLNHNLLAPAGHLGCFDVIFLRNVMIYFSQESKQKVINNVLRQLNPGGYFFISHTESLMNIHHGLTQIKPSIFQKL